MSKDKFNMPRTVAETLLKLRDGSKMVRMITAICDYEFGGILPNFSGEELALFEKLQAEIQAMNGGNRNGKK